jgi:hypothetical protein
VDRRDEVQAPDPSNAEPDEWAEPLDDEHQAEVRGLLGVPEDESEDAGGSEG